MSNTTSSRHGDVPKSAHDHLRDYLRMCFAIGLSKALHLELVSWIIKESSDVPKISSADGTWLGQEIEQFADALSSPEAKGMVGGILQTLFVRQVVQHIELMGLKHEVETLKRDVRKLAK